MEKECLALGKVRYKLSEGEMGLINRSKELRELLKKWRGNEKVVGRMDIQGKNEVLSMIMGLVELLGRENFVMNEVIRQKDGSEVVIESKSYAKT